jgi:hypothetical protein
MRKIYLFKATQNCGIVNYEKYRIGKRTSRRLYCREKKSGQKWRGRKRRVEQLRGGHERGEKRRGEEGRRGEERRGEEKYTKWPIPALRH